MWLMKVLPDHPLNSAALACWFAGTSLLILSRFIHRIPKIVSSAPKYSAIPLTERDPPLEEPFSPISLNSNSSLTLTRPRNSARWIKIGLLSVLGGLRIALYRDITAKIECAPDGYAVSVQQSDILTALTRFRWSSIQSPSSWPFMITGETNVANRLRDGLPRNTHRKHTSVR